MTHGKTELGASLFAINPDSEEPELKMAELVWTRRGYEWINDGNGLQALLDRKDFVCANVPHCPRCSEQMQIQVTNYLSVPAKWRCRMCKHRFVHEPTRD